VDVAQVISLDEHRRLRQSAAHASVGGPRAARRVICYFDLASPFTYLAAERVERLFSVLVWRPVLGAAAGLPAPDPLRAAARADALDLPIVGGGADAVSALPAMRIAALAAERGRAAPFVLAAGRLAWCGGFELDDPDVLFESAAAAGLDPGEALCAADDPGRDLAMEETGRRLVAQGAEALPALRVGRTLFAGEDRIGEAAAAARAPLSGRRAG